MNRIRADYNPGRGDEDSISDPSMVHQSTHAGITTALRLDYASVK
jgi:hypothetical protein